MALCGTEWNLFCWIRRELLKLKLKTKEKHTFLYIRKILDVMEAAFDDWPEDPK